MKALINERHVMARFLILFNASEPMSSFMARSTPKERQAGLETWTKWKTEAEKTVSFEFGAVVEALQRVENKEFKPSPNPASNYAFADADSKEAVAAALRNHPHLQRADSTIDILEVLPMPR